MEKIRYEFNDGTISEVEVSDEFYMQHLLLECKEEQANRRETRRHSSLEQLVEDGYPIVEQSGDPLELLIRQEDEDRLLNAMSELLPEQRNLLTKIFFEKKLPSDIAKEDGITNQAVYNRLSKIYTKLKKVLF